MNDGTQLYDDLLTQLPLVNKFIFSIWTNIDKKDVEINFSSNKYIQRSFSRNEYGPIQCHMHFKIDATSIQFHMNLKFFEIISQSFPLLKQLYVFNVKSQKNKQQSRPLIVFPDVLVLFLATNTFTSDATRLTCSKLTYLKIRHPFVPPENFYKYFPLL